MKLFCSTIVLILASCVVQHRPDPNRFYRDDLYCWKKDNNGNWRTLGTRDNCPEGTVFIR